MYYEINVAYKGSHFFATAKRSISDSEELQKRLVVFLRKFPASEGYSISVTRYEEIGYDVTDDFIPQA